MRSRKWEENAYVAYVVDDDDDNDNNNSNSNSNSNNNNNNDINSKRSCWENI